MPASGEPDCLQGVNTFKGGWLLWADQFNCQCPESTQPGIQRSQIQILVFSNTIILQKKDLAKCIINITLRYDKLS